jgi:hypothetical protein
VNRRGKKTERREREKLIDLVSCLHNISKDVEALKEQKLLPLVNAIEIFVVASLVTSATLVIIAVVRTDQKVANILSPIRKKFQTEKRELFPFISFL